LQLRANGAGRFLGMTTHVNYSNPFKVLPNFGDVCSTAGQRAAKARS
jgi:hypothetical protein